MSNLATLLNGLGRTPIAVFGDPMLDCYTWGQVDRVSPEAPVLVLRIDHREWRLGGAASVAGLLRGLDSQVSLNGAVGDDSPGQTLRRLLLENGIDHRGLVIDADRVTTTKERFLGRTANRSGAGGHQILRVDQEQCSPISEDIERALIESLENCLGDCSALLISDYNKGVCAPGALATLIEKARARQLPIVVDPARITDYSRYKNASVLIPNRSEAEAATGISIDGPRSAQAAAERLCHAASAEAVIIKLDSEGMVLYEANGCCRHFGTEAREVYDVTGAGDMVLAVVGRCLADGAPLADSVELANMAAGLQVERLGVQPITRQELSRAFENLRFPQRNSNTQGIVIPPSGGRHLTPFISRNLGRCAEAQASNTNSGPSFKPEPSATARRSATTAGISCSPILSTSLSVDSTTPSTRTPKLVTLSQAVSLAASYRSQRKSLVCTNGCFDLLHVGHVAYLEEAAKLGDVLLVAVNSDSGVRRLKGAGRPVIDESSRAAMLAALACVDHVMIFDEPTPHEILRAIRPEVLVKGGTYRLDEVIGREIVEAYGGTVRVLREVAGVSTTRILESMQNTRRVP
ncbi:MAG TPA: D-glycero-beta-D-manno-heptose 1-phosphate adenylyltransferase [Planctomycetaceae bacterium]|jgi:D-beta-D-heptose 7-phosphate kinase/D-beta-D-heptose 1-phosphate adenosyltransferase